MVLVLGCDEGAGGRGGGAGTFAPGGGVDDPVADGDDDDDGGGTDTDGTGEGGDEGDGSGVKFDTPNGSAGEEPEEEDGCQKVDFLFVIDSSRSMQDEQDNLLGSFPGFIAAIEDTLQVDDFHVMVVDAGELPGAGCEGTLGAGRTSSASGQDCQLAGGQRYATAEQADLTAAFSCMAARGYDGSPDERTMDAMVRSLVSETQPGACNEGFLRPDAILVVTVITDEEDSPSDNNADAAADGTCEPADADPNSNGDPGTWKNALVAIKGGIEESVVVLSLLGDCDIGGDCPGIAEPAFPFGEVTGAEPAPRLRAFTESFTYGSVGPVCAPDYTPFFVEAVSVIDSACSSFEPPG